MKTLTIAATAAALALAATGAKAMDYEHNNHKNKVHHDVSIQHSAPRYDATAHDPEAQKWVYSGSSAYRGGLAGQVAVQDRIGDGDDTAFVVRPVRGEQNQFNASLRYGDASQSREHHGNHVFNN